MISNFDLMANARRTLTERWGMSAWVTFVYLLISISIGAIPGAGQIVTLILSGPFMLGYTRYFLKISRGQDVVFNEIFSGFKEFERTFKAYLLMFLFVLLWTLLFVIPGIVALFRYSMVFFIMADDPDITATEAINKSIRMMMGNKGKLFSLFFRFIGWILLSILTFGVGFILLFPYMKTSLALFYEDLTDNPVETVEGSAS